MDDMPEWLTATLAFLATVTGFILVLALVRWLRGEQQKQREPETTVRQEEVFERAISSCRTCPDCHRMKVTIHTRDTSIKRLEAADGLKDGLLQQYREWHDKKDRELERAYEVIEYLQGELSASTEELAEEPQLS